MLALLEEKGRWEKMPDGMLFCTAERPGAPLNDRENCGGIIDEKTWRCTACGVGAEYSSWRGQCDLCKRACWIVRKGRRVTAACDCHLSDHKRKQLEAQEEQRKAKAQRKAEWEAAMLRQNAMLDEHRRLAAECLADEELNDRAGGPGQCREPRPPAHRFAFCPSCRVNCGGAR